MKHPIRCALAALTVVLAVGSAKADTVDNFTFTSGTNVYTFSFSEPVPEVFSNSTGFVTLAAVTYNGVTYSDGEEFFRPAGQSYTLNVRFSGSASGFIEAGPQLFTGPTSAPVFVAGTYALTGTAFGTGDSPSGTLVITRTVTTPVAATPEPSSLALLGTGVLGCIGAVRRRVLDRPMHRIG